MKRTLFGLLLLAAGLSLAQGTDYRQAALAAHALARLQAVAQAAQGEEKLLKWAQEVKARAERDYEAKAYFKAAREAQAALLLFRAARGQAAPAPPASHRGWDRGPGFGPRPGLEARLAQRAPGAVERAEKELAYYRGQDPLVKDLIAEAKGRLAKEPGRALLLAQAALALISAERGF
ncbi:MAG: hypothetical protein RMI36_03470 [Thermus sp.]|uniref:hypothetical protein n=1 Tax=Thermus sp. TaxID=275 RepID=UPI00298F037A|nr:hypothetical protein [Thermus sp.]MDW8016871.1 hypothetical protein [Thermus sp.]